MTRQTIAALVALALICGANLGTNADFPLRDATWTWIHGEYQGASCRARDAQRYPWDIWTTEGTLRVDADLTKGKSASDTMTSTEDYAKLLETRLEAAYDTHTESRELTAESFDFHYIFNAADFQQYPNAEQLYLTFLRLYPEWTATVDLEYPEWYYHWCTDKNEDSKCDYITIPDGEELAPLTHPPLSGEQQRYLTNCVNDNAELTVEVSRRDVQIAGTTDWPKLTQWTGACGRLPVPEDIPQTETPPPVETKQLCAIFNYLVYAFYVPLFGGDQELWDLTVEDFALGGQYETLCYPARSYEGYTGTEIRRYAIQQAGRFPGFTCPVSRTGTPPFSTAILRDGATKDQILNSLKAQVLQGTAPGPVP